MKDEIVCYCKQVSEATIVKAIRGGAHTFGTIKKATGACTGNWCKELSPKGRSCSSDILLLIEETTGTTGGTPCCCCGESGRRSETDSEPTTEKGE